MLITGVELAALRVPISVEQLISTRRITSRETCLVRIHTDEGIVGVGDSQRPESAEAICSYIRDIYVPLLLGRDPFDRERIFHEAYTTARYRGRVKGVAIEALSAVEIALWDVIGKALRVPIYRLLGGKYRDRLRAYATAVMLGPSQEERLRQFGRFLDAGFTAVKVKAGRNVEEDVEFLRRLREAYGYSVDILVDLNCALTFKTALRFGRAAEKYEVYWIEEPLPPEHLDDYAKLRRALSVMVAAGESEYTVYGFRDWLARGAIDVAQPDVGRAGGIWQVRAIAEMAEAHGIWFAPHTGHGSAIGYAATLHVAAATRNFLIFELEQIENPLREGLLANRVDLQEGGHIAVPEGPGLGIELDEKFVERATIARFK